MASRQFTTGPASSPRSSDTVLVQRVLGGDPASFALIMRRHNPRLFRVARAIVGEDTEAQDVLQQAYVSAYAHLDQFSAHAAFSTWLTRIVINEALAKRRSEQRAGALEEDDVAATWGAGSSTPTPEEHLSRRELVAMLEAAIDRLPDAYRTVVVLREIEGLSAAEAASCLGITEDAFRTRLHRSRSLLRADLRQRIGKEAPELFRFGGDRCDELVRAVLATLRGATARFDEQSDKTVRQLA